MTVRPSMKAEAAGHWSHQFPQLREADPRLDVIRSVRGMDVGNGHPLERFLATVEGAFDRPLDLCAPGDGTRTFDERWLLALLQALSEVDLGRYQFLLRSRLKAGAAARVHFALTQAQVWLDARL
ncbi:hypothetical protein [Sagittula stellata]|nr:hypothetical protein [Sagittula stellata]